VKERRTHLRGLTESLTALSPQGVLERGYAIVRRREEGTVITDAASTAAGEEVTVTFAGSELDAQVKETRTREKL
jgi:exodeoxyribonuclease VII large subunit